MLLETAFICLALKYLPRGEEPIIGRSDCNVISQVVMNRVEDNRFPNTVCEVVKE